MALSLLAFEHAGPHLTDSDFRAALADAEPAIGNAADAEDRVHALRASHAAENEASRKEYLLSPNERATLQVSQRHALPQLLISICLGAGSFLINFWSLSLIPNDLVRGTLSLGLTLGTVAFVDVSLSSYLHGEYVTFGLASSASTLMFFVEWLLAKVRVALLLASIQSTVVVSIDGSDSSAGVDDPMVRTVLPLLSMSLPLLAVAWELGLSITWYSALRTLWHPGLILWNESNRFEVEKVEHLAEAERIRAFRTNIPSAVLAMRTLRTNQRHLLGRVASLAAPLLVLALMLFLFASKAFANETSVSGSAVYLFDCSSSRPPSETSADQQFVSKALSLASPGSRQVVILITPDSWQEGRLLLNGKVGDDPGVLGQNLASARRQLQAAFLKRITSTRCGYSGTDVVGAIQFAQQVLSSDPGHPARWYLLSDMRQTQGVNLEHMDFRQLADLSPHVFPIPSLKGETVFVLGAQTSGSTPSYWSALQNFWISYFAESGASLRGYFVTRNVDAVLFPSQFPALQWQRPIVVSDGVNPAVHAEPRRESAQPHSASSRALFRIVSPATGSDSNLQTAIEGIGAGEDDSVWVIVRAVGNNEFWPNRAHLSGKEWSSQVVCGRPGIEDIGVHYQIMAVANPTSSLQHGVPVGSWPEAEKSSQLIEVIRR